MPDRVRHELDGDVLTITFDRPDRLNAVTSKTLLRLLEILDRAEQDDVRAVVLTGTGRAFTAGQDLEELGDSLAVADDAEHLRQIQVFQAITDKVLGSTKPYLAAINGVAVGFGAELALACDVRLASESARIGFVEATRGLFQTNGVLWLLPRVVGHGVASRMLLTGELLAAEEALRIGLVTSVHSPEDLLPATYQMARRIADNAPLTVRLVKAVLGVTWQETRAQVMQREVDGSLVCLRSEDLREGTAAFLDGRQPVYRGR